MGKDFYLGGSKAKLKKCLISSSVLLNTKALCCSVVLWEYYNMPEYYEM